MLPPILKDSEWVNRRLKLIHQHHQERIESFKREHESWLSLERAHHEQLIGLKTDASIVRRQADLIKEQTRQIQDWQREQALMRQQLNARQRQEMADLLEKH